MQFTLGMPFLGVLGKFDRNRKGLNSLFWVLEIIVVFIDTMGGFATEH